MARETLVDFLADLSAIDGDFLVFDDGYRAWSRTYRETFAASRAFAARLQGASFAKGDKVIIWSENRPEWIVALWGCLTAGVVAVPIDYRVSADFLERVRRRVQGRLVLAGSEVALDSRAGVFDVWPLADLDWTSADEPAAVPLGRDDVAEIIFTSGATAEPKGVVITHRNLLANIVPVEREVIKYRKLARPFKPIRFLNLLPLSHLFGQAMATFIPPLVEGTVVFMRGYNPAEITRQVKTRRVSVLVSVPKILEVLKEHVLRIAPEAAEAEREPEAAGGRGQEAGGRGQEAGGRGQEAGGRRQEAGGRRQEPGGERREAGPGASGLGPAAGGRGGRLRTLRNTAAQWWRYRRVHRAFGWKFWSFVVGAAPLEPALERFWSRLGYAVIQGYGLTETAPIVSLNHPFHMARGSVGKAIEGVEVKIAPDGEILVRGENVTRGYFEAGDETAEAFEDGWFHTGDIGELDADGRLFIRGRKKEMIVTPEGLNVFPDDVERELNAIDGVRDSAAVGVASGGNERVHAVLVLAPKVDPNEVVRKVNARLEDHQKVRGFSVWPGPELPRTEGTRKLKRRAIQQWVTSGGAASPPEIQPGGHSIAAILGRIAGKRTVDPTTTLGELGLSSLERVELMAELEDRFQTTIDEATFSDAASVADLQKLVESPAAREPSATEPVDFPAWNRRGWVRAVRAISQSLWILPLARVFAWIRVEGREHLRDIRGPVIFAANHQSHFDTPAILAALSPRRRYDVAPAMAKEFFKAHFFPEHFTKRQHFTNSVNYYLSAFFFNAFPLPQREAGARQTLRYVGELTSAGFSVLIYPEGARTEQGEIKPFRAGVAMMASRLRVPVVPVRLVGLDRVLHQRMRFPRPGPTLVKIGRPMSLKGEDYQALAKQVEDEVKRL